MIVRGGGGEEKRMGRGGGRGGGGGSVGGGGRGEGHGVTQTALILGKNGNTLLVIAVIFFFPNLFEAV